MCKSHHSNGSERVAMLGSFPPLRALSSYCLELALAIADLVQLEFISFSKIYPAFLYPGGGLKNDHSFPAIGHPNLRVKRRLTWYNPVTWIVEGLFTKADLLHAQWWSLPLILVYAVVCGGFKLRGKPVIFTVHNVLPHERIFFHIMASRLVFKLADHFIVHSASNRARLIKYYCIPPERVTQIPHGPLDFHVQGDVDRQAVRKEMGFRPENRVILLFGAIRPYKGIHTALKAFKEVCRKNPEARLLIVGKLWEKWERYERLIGELGVGEYVTTYLRYVSSANVCNYFMASDLVILPYHHFDSQSGVGAIAISFRKPMIVTNVGGLPELVEDHRFVVPPKDADALARAIIKCLKDYSQLEAMSKSTETIAARVAWPLIAKKTRAVYRKVLGTRDIPPET